MLSNTRTLSFALILVLLLEVAPLPAAVSDNLVAQIPLQPVVEPGELLVRFALQPNGQRATMAQQNQMLAVVGGKVQRIHEIVPGLSFVRLPDGADPAKAAETLGKQAGILYAEPNYRWYALDRFPSDPRFDELWGMHNTGQTGGVPDADIDAPEAWDTVIGSREIVVAVIDTGVDYLHPDLAANIWTNPGEIPANGIDDDGNGHVDDVHGYDFVNGDADPMDDHFHGTHCAGTIGAVGGNAEGVTGVCWQVRIMALKFLDSGGFGSTEDAVLCIEYAVRMGARVLSNSWGGGAYSQALKDAIDAAGRQGVLFVVAAGNDYGNNNDVNPVYPASYDSPNMLTVMATDHTDAVCGFSNYGPVSVDLGAPGSNILSCDLGGGYRVLNGTSMATPHVAGACALLWSMNSALPHWYVRECIMQGVDPTLPGQCASGGRLNLHQALKNMISPRGRVELDRANYSCADQIQIVLRDYDLRAQTSQEVTVSSGNGDQEIVTLSAAYAGLGFFEGAVNVVAGDPSPGDGILQVAAGATVTVSYQDADDGSGASATATATALIDCTPPVIFSDVQIHETPGPVTFTFYTDEPTRAVVRYGRACGSYDSDVADPVLKMSHTLSLKNLSPETACFAELRATDEAGNTSVADNGGGCYSFTSPPLRVPSGYRDIQSAVDSAPGGETVMLAPGVFIGPGNVEVRFNGKQVAVRGELGPADTIIDCQDKGRAFILDSGEGPGAVLENLAIRNGFHSQGGGILCYQSSPTIRNCVVSDCSAAVGGGIYAYSSAPSVIGCTFTGNHGTSGGAMSIARGSGGLISGCRIISNEATGGGGIDAHEQNGLAVVNCAISLNHATSGGAIDAFASQVDVLHCTMVANTATSNAAIRGDSGVRVANSIIYDNGTRPPLSPSLTITYSDVQNGWPGEGNLDQDPCLFSTESFSLLSISPCIDAGTNAPFGDPALLPSSDLAGTPRPADGDGDGEAVADMGAHEYLPDWHTATVFRVPSQYPTIQAGIDAAVAEGDVVLVADGTYRGVGNHDIDLRGKSIRLRSENGPAACIIDCQGLGRGFYVTKHESEHVVVEGFTITGGSAQHGAGLYFDNSGPTFVNCVVEGNVASSWGGGLYANNYARPILVNCRVENNQGREGAGAHVTVYSKLTCRDCIFSGNIASMGGGGLWSVSRALVELTGCTFSNNRATHGAGAFVIDSGNSIISGCTFSNNQATSYGGAGLRIHACQPTVTVCVFMGNQAAANGGGVLFDVQSGGLLANCLSYDNTAADGAGICCNSGSNPVIVNCTSYGNHSSDRGGGLFCYGSSPAVSNSIFWFNEAARGPEVALAFLHERYAAPAIGYSNVRGGRLGVYCEDASAPIWNPGNIDADPLFAGSLELRPGSPCIDSGDNSAVPAGLTVDLAEAPRFVDDPDSPDTGSGTAPLVDMGAYEYQPRILGRYVFYNESWYDGGNPGLNSSDDAAIAADKAALRQGQAGSFANYITCAQGITGIMVDMFSVPVAPVPGQDVLFQLAGRDAAAAEPGPAPSAILVRPGAGALGSDRIAFAWPAGVIPNTCWLRVILRADINGGSLGLQQDDVFCFGLAIGETGSVVDTMALVSPTDELAIRQNYAPPIGPRMPISCPYDVNKDGLVNPTDEIIARTHRTTPLNCLLLPDLR